MHSTTNRQKLRPATDTPLTASQTHIEAKKPHDIELIFWAIGALIFVVSCFIIHSHPQPYPFDLAVTQTVQSLHLWPWVNSVLEFPSALNDPIPSTIAIATWFFGMLLVGGFFRLRRKSGFGWFMAAFFLLLAVMSSASINVGFNELV